MSSKFSGKEGHRDISRACCARVVGEARDEGEGRPSQRRFWVIAGLKGEVELDVVVVGGGGVDIDVKLRSVKRLTVREILKALGEEEVSHDLGVSAFSILQ